MKNSPKYKEMLCSWQILRDRLIYIHIYIHTHTHTHTYIYIYIFGKNSDRLLWMSKKIF